MPVTHHDIETALQDLSDLIRSESEPAHRLDLFETMLQRGSDIANRGVFGSAYDMRASGIPTEKIAEHFSCSAWTVVRWTNEYAEDNGLPRLGRPAKVKQSVHIGPRYKRSKGGQV